LEEYQFPCLKATSPVVGLLCLASVQFVGGMVIYRNRMYHGKVGMEGGAVYYTSYPLHQTEHHRHAKQILKYHPAGTG